MSKKLVALMLVVVCVLSLAATAFAGRVDLAKVARIQQGIAQCRAAISRCQQEINKGRNVANNTRLKKSYQSQLNQLYVMLRQAQNGY